MIDPSTPYLNDSGAQYLDGTIDTTRTVHFGKPTKMHKLAFTRVLQGHIALDRLVFPEGTTGNLVEALARAPLWSEGMSEWLVGWQWSDLCADWLSWWMADYLHGTGVGVLPTLFSPPHADSFFRSTASANTSPSTKARKALAAPPASAVSPPVSLL